MGRDHGSGASCNMINSGKDSQWQDNNTVCHVAEFMATHVNSHECLSCVVMAILVVPSKCQSLFCPHHDPVW